jgi:hypothetical protein
MADTSAVRDITAQLEQGVKDLFDSDKYAAYLQTISRFHNYSTRNTLLIHMQYPNASRVASYLSWKNNFNRQVKKGEHGIKIFAPVPHNETKEFEKLDPLTKRPIIGDDGQPVMETLMRQGVSFKTVNVFAYEQTTGEPLPELAEPLMGGVERYELFMDALRAVSPLPIVFEDLPPDTDGQCHFGDRIAIRNGMSEAQTVSAAIHEITHAKIHDRELNPDYEKKDRGQIETEAEGCAYVANFHFGVDTGANSFGYVAEYAKSKELKELQASLDTIRKTAGELIDGIDKEYRALAKERGIDLSVTAPARENAQGQATEANTQAMAAKPAPAAESALTMNYTETRAVGDTVLMPLLYEDGNLNRSGKRSKVKIEPPIGKYSLYSRDEGDAGYTYIMTNSGRLMMLGETSRLTEITEQKLDEHIKTLAAAFTEQLSDPDIWADFAGAAALNRIEDADVHNIPIRNKREEQYRQEQQARAAESKRERETHETAFNATIGEIADKHANGEKAEVEPDRYMNKNPLIALFAKHGVDLPLATKGWVNKNLKAIQIRDDGHNSFWLPKGVKVSETFSRAVRELRSRIIASRIPEKSQERESQPQIGMIGGTLAEIHSSGNVPTTPPPKQSVAKDLYTKLWEQFPRFMSKEYSYLRLEADGFEPLSLEWIGKDRFSLMHTYELNGDLCYDPDIVFEVDRNAHTANAVMFQQSVPPLYQERQDSGEWLSVGASGEQHTRSDRLGRKINDFANRWLDNIKEQGHIPVRANMEIDGEETQITFTKDGTPILPDAKESEPQCRDEEEAAGGDRTDREDRDEYGNWDGDPVPYYRRETAKEAEAASKPETSETPEKFAELDLSLPDQAWTQAEMFEYGYTETDMFPLSVGRAVELFDTNHPIYLLYPDNTEALALDKGEIITFSSEGFCGITKADWEMSPVYKAQLAIAENLSANSQAAKESDLLFGDECKFGIYQIKDAPGLRDFRFSNSDDLKRLNLRVERENYDLVYAGRLDIHDTQINLHKIFNDFNMDNPPDGYTGHSVSVSDVIVLQWRGEVSAHFVDSAGFKELARFTGNERERKITLTEQEVLAKAKANNQAHTAETAPAKQPPMSKAKTSLLGRLEANKLKVAQAKQAAVKPPQTERRTDDDRTIHG